MSRLTASHSDKASRTRSRRKAATGRKRSGTESRLHDSCAARASADSSMNGRTAIVPVSVMRIILRIRHRKQVASRQQPVERGNWLLTAFPLLSTRMSFDPLAPLPWVTAGLPGIGGRIRDRPEDFDVEEIPAYAPSGQGDFLYLWIEKRDMGADYFVRQVSKRLGISPQEIGMAGLKDRRAVTRQWISVPLDAESALEALESEGI